MSNSNSDVNDATCGVPERTSDLIEHAPDVGDSTPNVAEHTSDVSDPISNVTEHSSDVSDPTSDGSDPVSEASEHTSDVPKHTSDVDDPTSNVAKDTSKVIEHISNAGDSTSKVSKSKKPVDSDDLKKVVARGIRGVVKWFSARNHYGFICRSDTGQDIFVHVSGIVYQSNSIRYALDENQEVEMNVCDGPKGPEAGSVTLPGGYPVKGKRILSDRFRRPHRAGKAPNKKKVTNDKENCIVDVVVIEETSKSNKKKTVPNKPTEEELLQKKKARNAFRRQKRYLRKIEKQTKGEVDTVENVIEVK